MGTIQYGEFMQAGRNWDAVFAPKRNHNDGPTWKHGLNKFLEFDIERKAVWHDDNYYSYSNNRLVRMDDEACRKMKLLAGPHYKAIIKAWQIQQKELLADHEKVTYKK